MKFPLKKTAICYIIDGKGRRVLCEGQPVEVARDIVTVSDEQAKEILQRAGFEFIKWW